MSDLRFNRVAALYSKVRPTYPKEVFEHLLEAGQVKRFPNAVDIGCGAGQSLVGLRQIADHIIGIEPADKLRSEAKQAHPELDIRDGSGEETGLSDDSADVITVATAFYWMDKRKALAEVHRVLRSPGVFATYKYDFPRCIGPADQVLTQHLDKHWDEHRSKRLTDYDNTADLMRESGYFATVTSPVVPYVLSYPSTDGFVEFMCSTSYVSAFLATLDNADAYVERFAEEMRAVHSDKLDVRFDIIMNIGTRR